MCSENQVWICSGEQKNTPQTCGDNTALCIQLWMPSGILWGIPGMSREGEEKVGHFTLRRADWCWCSSSALLTFLRPRLLSVTCTAQDLQSPLLFLLFVHKAGTLKDFQHKCWNYFLNCWMEVCFRVIYSFGLLCFLAFPMRTASCLMTRLCNWGNALFLEESLQQPASASPR